MTYTHIFRESGNGFPRDGETVIEPADDGWHKLLRVVDSSPIHTGNAMAGDANFLYLRCEAADQDFDDLSEAAADAAYEDMHHVAPIHA